jgi:hypothetical protein
MSDGQTETVLADSPPASTQPGSDYTAAGGYVAYRALDANQVLQVWRHGPGGEQQLTQFGADSTLDALGPDGTVFLSNRLRRYRAVPGQSLQEVSSGLGRVIYRDGDYLVLMGSAVLVVNP